MQRETHEVPVPGVRTLDHTADVGIEVNAPDLPELVRRSALGLTWLLLEREPSGAMDERSLKIEAISRPALLREVLRELLWWHDSEGLCTADVVNISVTQSKRGLFFTAVARLVHVKGAPVREIKGVTLHGLAAERRGENNWYGRVIFDV
jgi:SHS2 domain-containing protein